MRGKYKVIALCGCNKFKDDFIREQRRLTLAGNVVIGVDECVHADDISLSEKILLHDIHMQKLDMADEIFIINKHDYIDWFTQQEINYAALKNMPIIYMEKRYEASR